MPGQDPNGADGEVLLDIEVAGALAPGAHIIVYFAPNTDAGFVDAVTTAAHATPTPAAISISWGQSEDQWTAQARTAFDQALVDAAALGVTTTAAAGDDGSTDRETDGRPHVDFPASSPHALACGGTRLAADADHGDRAVGDGVEQRSGSRGDRRRRERRLPATGVAGERRRAVAGAGVRARAYRTSRPSPTRRPGTASSSTARRS